MIPTVNFPMKLESTSLIQIRFFSDGVLGSLCSSPQAVVSPMEQDEINLRKT